MTRLIVDTAARLASDLIVFLDPAKVRAELDKAKNSFITVTFLTVKGELRTYNCQLRAASRLVGSERGQAQGAAMKERGQVWIALPNGQSKSFYIDRVVALKANGRHLQAGL